MKEKESTVLFFLRVKGKGLLLAITDEKKNHHSESSALISLHTGKFYVKRYSSQVWKQLLMFLTFYIFF